MSLHDGFLEESTTGKLEAVVSHVFPEGRLLLSRRADRHAKISQKKARLGEDGGLGEGTHFSR